MIRNNINTTKVKRAIVPLYCIGALGFLFPETRTVFIFLTPFILLINTLLLLSYHEKHSSKSIAVFALIFSLGFAVEVLGVNTGFPFGNYQYGTGLGIKFWGTPLLIGVNWLFLSYASYTVVHKIKLPFVLSVIAVPSLMICYDLLLEQVAPKMDMWSWSNERIPLQNYIAWYVIALVFSIVMHLAKIKTHNKIASTILICQFLFFAVLMLVMK